MPKGICFGYPSTSSFTLNFVIDTFEEILVDMEEHYFIPYQVLSSLENKLNLNENLCCYNSYKEKATPSILLLR